MNKRSSARKPRRLGMTLIELLVVMALFNVIVIFLFIFYRAANVEFEEASTNMGLAQYARIVSDRILPYASTAIPISTQQQNFIYSPSAELRNDTTLIPNIYNLDYVTTTDFLSPSSVSSGSFDGITDDALTGTVYPAMSIVRRGYSAADDHFYRYRIRFDVPTMKLWLERVSATAAVALNGGTVALPATDNPVGHPRPPKLLGYDLNSVEFRRVDNCITVRISITQLLRVQGKNRWFQGQQLRNNLGQSRDSNTTTGAANRRGKEVVAYTTILLPVYTGK